MKFIKAHSYGNSFIIIDGEQLKSCRRPIKDLARNFCSSYDGFDADGLLVMLPSKVADLRMRIVNSDGSEAQMCGNGIRCLAYYVFTHKILKKSEFAIETLGGIINVKLKLKARNEVVNITTNLGRPIVKTFDYPLSLKLPAEYGGKKIKPYVTSVQVGVPHIVIFVKNVDIDDVIIIGPLIERHALFKQGTNVNFAQVIDSSSIKIATWERGVGMTLACCTGACATVVASCLYGYTTPQVKVYFDQGEAIINWCKDDTLTMLGSVPTIIGEGEFFCKKNAPTNKATITNARCCLSCKRCSKNCRDHCTQKSFY